MPRRLAVVGNALFVTLALCWVALCTETGVIEGTVLNGTEADAPIADASVMLLAWRGDEQLEPRIATTDGEGLFRFADLETAGRVYRLVAEYEEITYGFEPRSFPPDETLISVPLTVYETTTADDTLVDDRVHLIISREVGVPHLHVQEVHVFANESGRTYLGPAEVELEMQGTIRFVLPPDAANVEWLGGFPEESIAISSEGFDYVLPVLPGTAQFTFSYTLPFPEVSYSLEKVFAYATRHVDIFASSGVVSLTAPQLTDAGPVSMMEASYSHFTGENLASGAVLALTFDRVDSPELAPTEGSSMLPTGVIVAVAAVLILAVLTYPFIRRRGRRAG
jgi:hypothetical protein